MEVIIVAVAGLLTVAAAAAIAPRLRIAAPLLLVVLGIGISFLPFIPEVEVDPEWIIAGVLPPLLYSSSVAMPAMNFRREFTAIRGLAVALVVLSAVVLGGFFAWALGLDIWWGIALGAIVSPTDAVATSIVRSVGVSGRVSSVLGGESLLNDATALVLLRSAIAGTVAAVSLRHVALDFAYAVAVAVVLGFVVGHLNLWVRSKIADSTVNTIVSFTVPFLASIPAELLDASGLVAAVVAGLITGHGAPRVLPPEHRQSDAQNWHAIELVLEGVIFLVMGLELSGIVEDVRDQHAGLGTAALVAASALMLVLAVRAAYIAALLAGLSRRARRKVRVKDRLHDVQERLDDQGGLLEQRSGRPAPTPAHLDRVRTRTRRSLADIDYFLAKPLGWRDGAVLVWAGMRGAVTLAAAQTLPPDTPQRSLLVLIAFMVAAASLLLQGGTLAAFVRWVRPAEPEVDPTAEADLVTLLSDVQLRVIDQAPAEQRNAVEPPQLLTSHFSMSPELSRQVLDAQRNALLDARDDGLFGSELLESALERLDAAQLGLDLRR